MWRCGCAIWLCNVLVQDTPHLHVTMRKQILSFIYICASGTNDDVFSHVTFVGKSNVFVDEIHKALIIEL